MIQVSPQSSDKCPEKHTEREAHREEDLARTGAGSWRDRRFSPRTFGGSAACRHLDSELVVLCHQVSNPRKNM